MIDSSHIPHLNIKYKVEDLIVYIQNIIWQ